MYQCDDTGGKVEVGAIAGRKINEWAAGWFHICKKRGIVPIWMVFMSCKCYLISTHLILILYSHQKQTQDAR
jgi:hypothetical protein